MTNTGNHNTGYSNSGNRNTGYSNSGNRNTGCFNTGDRNTGSYNTGSHNTGSWNIGDRNTGYHNTGDRNSGDYNTGNCNTGYHNSGYRNSGDYNTGSHNTGSWNSGNCNSGSFNTITPEGGYYFNRWLTHEEWDKIYKPNWLYEISPTTWVPSENMTAEEKATHPDHETTGGYFRVNDMKAEWRKAYDAASPEDREAVKSLPNFDAEIFLEITGLDLRDQPEAAPCEGREIEIDGVTYVLKAKMEKTND